MFKRAFVRGIQTQLIQNDRAVYPTEKIATEVSDYIADNMDFDPVDSNNLTYDKVAEIANHLIDASNALLQNGYTANPAVKTASLRSLEKVAHDAVLDLMYKAAEGSTIEGGDKGNKEPSSGEGKMDMSMRPQGYAEDSRGKTDVDTKPGAVGKESDNPAGPHNSPSGANSVTEQRTASLKEAILKLAEGSTILGGDKGNKEPTTGEGKMDLSMRPHGYAENSRGKTDVDTRPGALGKEMPHPKMPGEHPAGSNSVVTQAKAANEDPFLTLFKKVASEVHELLPTKMSREDKVAHVKKMMGMDVNEKAAYILDVFKTAGELPPFMKKEEKTEMKEEGKDHEKKETKEEEKKEHKEASLLDVYEQVARK